MEGPSRLLLEQARQGSYPPGPTPPVGDGDEGVAGVGEAGALGVSGVGVAGAGVAVCSGSAPAFGTPGAASPLPPGVADLPLSLPASVLAPGFGAVRLTGAVTVPVGVPVSASPVLEVPIPPLLVGPLGCAACSDRAFSTCSAETMKLCQISAGKVPPSTGPPLKSVVIGTRLFG